MQENTDFTIEFSCFESDYAHACWSTIIHPTDSLPEFNKHPTHIACRTETIHNGPEIVQVLDCALDSCIQGPQVTVVCLHLDLSRKFTY